ncbi:hypothetical protein ACA910_003363 [Epithemia clementina (nom. ined.)]
MRSMLSVTEVEDSLQHLHNPPTGSSLVSQAWSSPVLVPTVTKMTAQLSLPSSKTQEKLDRMHPENVQLRRDMQELREQLCQEHYQTLVSAFMAAMQQQS